MSGQRWVKCKRVNLLDLFPSPTLALALLLLCFFKGKCALPHINISSPTGLKFMVNCSIMTPLMVAFFSFVVHVLNSEWSYTGLTEVTLISSSGTENSEFPRVDGSLQSWLNLLSGTSLSFITLEVLFIPNYSTASQVTVWCLNV